MLTPGAAAVRGRLRRAGLAVAVAAERGIRRVLRTHRVDVLHLRMADVGSLAAAEVARELGIPTVFTLAPDPHAVIHALDMTGALHRGNFGTVDEREHYWFRAGLVRRLAAGAAHIVLFPRPELQHDMRELLGVDIGRAARPVHRRAGGHRPRSVPRPPPSWSGRERPGPALAELDALVAALPEHRRRLPLVISVGRLHRVKGMATVVEAWAGDPELAERCNLLIVGGDLADPSPDERGQLDLIAEVLAAVPRGRRGSDAARPPTQRRGGALAGGRAGRAGRAASARAGCTSAAA